jgi:hypothetical protein
MVSKKCFAHCAALTKPVFESLATVQRIDLRAFCNCISLTSFRMPSSLSTLGISWMLRNVICDIRYSITTDEYSRSPFSDWRCLRTLTLPDSVTAIADPRVRCIGVNLGVHLDHFNPRGRSAHWESANRSMFVLTLSLCTWNGMSWLWGRQSVRRINVMYTDSECL